MSTNKPFVKDADFVVCFGRRVKFICHGLSHCIHGETECKVWEEDLSDFEEMEANATPSTCNLCGVQIFEGFLCSECLENND